MSCSVVQDWRAERVGPVQPWTNDSSMKFSVGLLTSLLCEALLRSFLSRADFGTPELAKIKPCAAVRQTGLVHFICLAQCCNAEMWNPLKL